MADVIFLAVIVAFFGVALALVKACDRIIGPDLVLTDEPATADVELPDVAAGAVAS